MPDVRRATTPGSLPSEHRPGRTQTLPAIVFGGHVTALGVVRSLGEAGIPAYVVSPRGDYASRSRWAKPLAEGPPESPDAGSLAVFLEALPFERALLLPCSDDWVRAVAALPEAVRRRFPSPVAPLETLEHFLDKARFAALVERMDVPHPPTAVLVPGDERALDNFDFGSGDSRFFLKPTDSQHFVRHFGVKAFAVAGRAEARARLAEIWGAGLESMLVQEYVPGLASSHYFVDGFVSADGRLAAQLVRRRLRMYPRDFGNSTYHVSVPAEEVAGAAGHLERMLAAVEYRGIFSAEFKRDARDGELRILEVNVRPWWYIHFATTCGVNVCELAHREALGLPLEPVNSYTVGAHSVLLGADLRAYLDQRGESGVSLTAFLASWRRATPTILSLRDPLPGIIQLSEVGARWLGRRLPSRLRHRRST